MNRIIIDANKRALVQWKQYQARICTADELAEQRRSPRAHGEAVICGQISGGLEVVDVDAKYDLTGVLKEELLGAIPADILARLHIVQTGGKREPEKRGLHLYYTCESIEGNQPLARRDATEAEQQAKPGEKVKVLIETRGEGGYVVAPPTDGYSHVMGPDKPQGITPRQRETLFAVCRSFNTLVVEERPPVSQGV